MIVFIGGAPRVGKSMLARMVREKLGISASSTDALRWGAKQLKQIPSTDDLFLLDQLKEWDERDVFYAKYTPEEIIAFQNRESVEVAKVVRGFVESTAYRHENFLLEGVALLPELYDPDFLTTYDVRFFCVGNTDYPSFVQFAWEHRAPGDWLADSSKETFEHVLTYCTEMSKLFQQSAKHSVLPYFELSSETFMSDLEKAAQIIIDSSVSSTLLL